MKTLTHTIIAFVALSLLAAGFAPAQNVSGEEVRDSFGKQAREVEVAAVLAQVQASRIAAPKKSTPPSIPSPSPAHPNEPASVADANNQIVNLTRHLTNLTRGASYGSRSGSTGTVLVIPSEQTKTEDLLTINEDMTVMSRIFEKNIEQARIKTVRGGMIIPTHDPFLTLLGGGRGGIQSIYLQGFGALFLMNVDFPLSPPPDMQDDEKETIKKEEGDPVWREMRREMYEPENVTRGRRTDRPEEKYDAEKVENLKTTLIKALKHAANIRSLKPDESVILTVTGSSKATGTTITSTMFSGGNQILLQERTTDGKMMTKVVTGSALDDIGLSSPAILVIRTKKSDIDAFAKGDLDFDQFRQRVQLLTCPLLGGAAERGDPYNPYGWPRSTGSYGSRSSGSSNRR
ncbi:hypothetical protein ACFL5F_04595 [Planctomycetota bacterium]